jgi:4-amino-4-deoxy-L-arabinose transferase-like glycosyltransferase
MNDPDCGTSATMVKRILDAIETRLYELNERNHPFFRFLEWVNDLWARVVFRAVRRRAHKIDDVITGRDNAGRLRFLTPDDLDVFADLIARFDFKYLPPHPCDRETAARVLRRPSYLPFGIFVDDQAVGYTLLRLLFPRRAFTGVWTLTTEHTAGLSRAAVKRTGQFTDAEGITDYATVPLDNTVSLRAAEWAGWRVLRKNRRFHLLRRPLPHRRFSRPRAQLWAILIVALALFAGRLVHTASEKSFTVDEPLYLGTALYLWETGDYDFVKSLRFHPPLAYHLAGLPLLGLDLGNRRPSPDLGTELIDASVPSTDLLRVRSRLPFILLACWGAVLIFLWARELAGSAAAVLAVFFYTFSPTVLANAPLVHSDITVTVFYLQTLYCVWRWVENPSLIRFCLCGFSLGLALLSKLSGLLLLPTIALVLTARAAGYSSFFRRSSRRPLTQIATGLVLAAVSLIGLLGLATVILWAGYGGSLAASRVSSGLFAGWVLPGYLHSLFFDVFVNALAGRTVFLLGSYSTQGWWYFFPVAFLLKTPAGFVFLALLAALAPRRRAGTGAVVSSAILVYGLVACLWLRVPLGFRYVLPIIPLLHLWVATRLTPLGKGWNRRAVLAGCVCTIAASVWVHPHYLAYFSELVGGPKRGYNYLVDSDLDWGQDLGTLASYLQSRGNPPLWLAYYGPEEPARYGIRARKLGGCKPVGGLVAISATVLRGLAAPARSLSPPVRGCYDWVLTKTPVAQPGYSILVYELPEPE